MLYVVSLVLMTPAPIAQAAAAQTFDIYTASGTKLGGSAPSIPTAYKVFAQGATGTDGLPVAGTKILLQGVGFKAASPILAQFSKTAAAAPQNSNDKAAWEDITTYSPTGSSPCVPDASGNFTGCYVIVPPRSTSTSAPYWLQMRDTSSGNWSISTSGFGIVTPDLAITPTSALIATGQSRGFVGSGGGVSSTAPYAWEIDDPAYGALSSNGTYNANMIYQAGSEPGTNVITLSDADGNSVTATIEVATLQATEVSDVVGHATYGETATLAAMLWVGSTPLANKTVTFTYGGRTYTATTDSSGVATKTAVPLATGHTNAGTVPGVVTASFAGDSTYSGNSSTGDLIVAQRPVTVTADAKSKATGSADPALTHQITSGSLVAGDSFSGSLTREPGEGVGTYAIQQGSLTLGGNYDLTFVEAYLTIAGYEATAHLENLDQTYDGAPHPVLVTTDPVGLAYTISYEGTASTTYGPTETPPINAGTYNVTVTIADETGPYFGSVTDTLTVAKRSVTVTADAQTKVFGEADPELTYQITSGSLVAGDDFSGSLTRMAGENAGTYAIQQGSLTLGDNYDLTVVEANLTILPADQAEFTLAVPTSITYGETGTAVAEGGEGSGAVTFDAGDSTGCTIDPISGIITVTDATGTCEITATKAGDDSYSPITIGPKPVALSKADATITVTGYSVTYDGDSHTATGTAKGARNEDLSDLLDLSGTTHTEAGTYSDTWSFAGTNNYNDATGLVTNRITVMTSGTLLGTVQTAAGFEVAGIELFLVNSEGETVAQTTTGAGGTYRFESLPGDTYTVKVKSVDAPLTQATKAVPGTGETTLNLVIPATATLRLVANPATIVGNGRSTSQLRAELSLLDNTPLAGVEVIFSATDGTLTSLDERTGFDGKAHATLRAPLIEGLDQVVQEASVRVHDPELGLFAFAKIEIIFAPSSIDGVVLDNGAPRKPIAGAIVSIYKDFGDGNVFEAQAVTDAEGRYSIIVPKGNTTYEAEITVPVMVGGVETLITTKQAAVVGEASGSGDATPATKTVSGQLFAPDPVGGGVQPIDMVLIGGEQVVGSLFTTGGTLVTAVTVDANGAFRAEDVEPGTYAAVFQVKAPDGQLLAGVSVPFTVSADGELTVGVGLIDPFGIVTDKATGSPIEGVKMELRWADTPLNISKGRKPDAAVDLPELVTFLPNQNHVPQLTTNKGEYAWMVFPDGDYYIIATKSGYRTYDSRTEGRNVPVKPGEDGYVTTGIIHVGTTIVEYDLQMTALSPTPPSPPVTPPVTPPTPSSPQGRIVGKLLFVDVDGGAPKDLSVAQAHSLTAILETADGQLVEKAVTIDASGLYEVKDLAPGTYWILFRAKGADGRLLAVTAVNVRAEAMGEPEQQTTVIDPFRTIRDAVTRRPLQGVLVSLLWADTSLNRNAGRTPGTLAPLPGLTPFAPHGNANPHTTNELGRYGAFCLPQGDYYLIAKKDGYLPYDSRNDARTFSLGAGGVMKDGILHVSNGGCAIDIELEPMKLEVLPQYTRYILGYPDGTFKPEREVTRAEVAAIFSRLLGTDLAKVEPVNLKDVRATHWAARYIAAVMGRGLMSGDPDGGFRPDAPITRAELAAVVVRFKRLPMGRTGIFQDTADHWAEPYIGAAFQAGLVLGYTDNTFAPSRTTTRAELVAMVNRLLGWAQLVTGKAEPRWPDVPFSHWAARHIEKASFSHTAKPGEDQLDYLVEVLPDNVQ